MKQVKIGLFIQNLCKTEHPGDYERDEAVDDKTSAV